MKFNKRKKYVIDVLNSSNLTEQDKEACIALYLYCEAANVYFN